jgi:hypothetical protein
MFVPFWNVLQSTHSTAPVSYSMKEQLPHVPHCQIKGSLFLACSLKLIVFMLDYLSMT